MKDLQKKQRKRRLSKPSKRWFSKKFLGDLELTSRALHKDDEMYFLDSSYRISEDNKLAYKLRFRLCQ